MQTDFFGVTKTYQITAEFVKQKGGIIFDDRRDIQRFVYWDEREYIKKRVDLSQLTNVESIYCVETETTTILQTKEKE